MELFSRVLPNAVRASVPPPLYSLCWKRAPLLFLTLEDRPLAFVAAAVLRLALGREAVALLLRPGDCFLSQSETPPLSSRVENDRSNNIIDSSILDRTSFRASRYRLDR
jgi:hypothetical protein